MKEILMEKGIIPGLEWKGFEELEEDYKTLKMKIKSST